MPDTVDRLNTTVSRWSPRQLVRRALVRCIPRSRLLESLPGTGSVYLTFDDGPHPEHTPRLLDVLAGHQVRATFFLLGHRCVEHPPILQRIVADGHTVGNHSYSHLDARAVQPRNYLNDIRQSEEVLRQFIGVKPRLFRPPFGRLSLSTFLPLIFGGRTIVLWNVDVRDYETGPAEIQTWLTNHPLRDGDILLMHDAHPYAAAILPSIIRQAIASGLTCRALPSYISRFGDRRSAA